MAIAPVCGMEVDESTTLRTEYEGKSYYFCSIFCKYVFEREPYRYASEGTRI